jgi:hypothetical protein
MRNGCKKAALDIVFSLVFLAIAGCGSDDGCVLNSTRECFCSGTTPGTQVCLDGSNYSECQCNGVVNIGAGGASGGNGTRVVPSLAHFSFFVTSLETLQRLSGNQNGFGGDFRYGEADGISGADKICREIAEYSMPGSGAKQWRAFLSATQGANGGPVNAIERIGTGPWYDRLGRLLAGSTADLVNTRPVGADSEIVNDLPNEYGVPNHAPNGTLVDNHHMLTGSNEQGMLGQNDRRDTCQDWTSSVGSDGAPRYGMSWPRSLGGGRRGGIAGAHWISDGNEAVCAASFVLDGFGGASRGSSGVGSGGGYGGFYCFALTP